MILSFFFLLLAVCSINARLDPVKTEKLNEEMLKLVKTTTAMWKVNAPDERKFMQTIVPLAVDFKKSSVDRVKELAEKIMESKPEHTLGSAMETAEDIVKYYEDIYKALEEEGFGLEGKEVFGRVAALSVQNSFVEAPCKDKKQRIQHLINEH